MLVTLGLAVVVLALGNGLLYIGRRNNNAGAVFAENPDSSKLEKEFNSISENRGGKHYMEKRMSLINTRLAKLEQYLGNGNRKSNSNETDYTLHRKMERLEEFKREAEIEIRAIRDYLSKRNNAFQKKMQKTDKELDKKIHSLVFNTKKKKK